MASPMYAGSPNSGAQALVLRKVAWRLIPFMGLLYLLAFLDRVNVGFAALTMKADLGFSPTVFGAGAGVFFVGYVLFGLPSNLMLHRLGARRWIATIMVSWGVVSGAMAFIRLPAHFYALRFLLGVSEAGFFPGMILYLAYWFPKSQHARILGAFMVALPLSSVLGSPISAMLLDLNAFGLHGWQLLFLLEGIPAVAVGVLVLKYLTDRPEEANWLSEQECAILINSLKDALPPPEKSNARHAFTQPRVWALSAVYFALLVSLYGYNFWLPQIIQNLGTFSHRQIGGLTMLPNMAAALLMYAWAVHSDSTQEHRWHVALPLLLAAGGLSASAYLRNPAVSMMALTVGAVGIYCALPVFWSLPSKRLRGTSAAAGIALINTVGSVGGYVGSTAMGYLREATSGYSEGLLLLATGVAAAALSMFWTG